MSRPLPQASPPTLSPAARHSQPSPRPSLRVFDAMALIVGTVVGAGIFRTPPLIAANAASESVVIIAWIVGGAISLIGALCYAELVTAYPNVGGDYHYLTRAFGLRLAFLFAWARITVIQTGSIALLAFVIGDYASALVPLGPFSPAIYAAFAIVVMTGINVMGVRQGKLAQNVLTLAEVLGLLLVVVTGLAFPAPAPSGPGAPATGVVTSGFGLIMVFVLLTYGGWNEAAYISAEVRGPRHNMARALLWSILVVTVLYVLVNWAYLRGLGLAGMAQSQAIAADLVERAAGPHGARLVALLILVSVITSLNSVVFTGARTAYALGRDIRPLSFLGRWHATAGTPTNALLAQGGMALMLILVGGVMRKGFETMVEYTAPVFWLFFLLTGVSLFVLRRREPGTPRPFKVPLYPLMPLLFCASCTYLLYSSLVYTGAGALAGVAVLATGAVALMLMRRHDIEQ